MSLYVTIWSVYGVDRKRTKEQAADLLSHSPFTLNCIWYAKDLRVTGGLLFAPEGAGIGKGPRGDICETISGRTGGRTCGAWHGTGTEKHEPSAGSADSRSITHSHRAAARMHGSRTTSGRYHVFRSLNWTSPTSERRTSGAIEREVTALTERMRLECSRVCGRGQRIFTGGFNSQSTGLQ